MSAVEMNDKGLRDLLKALSGADKIKVRVGILGKNQRQGKGSNAEIGAKHEFGSDGMPIRSFLRVPIIDNLQKYLNKSDAFNRDTLMEIVRTKTILPWLKKLAVIGETIVLDGFQTGGFGKWKPSDMRFKKNHQTLVETQQLRNSITSDVK